jgi:SOS-response transcriptional repressor LexA
MEPTIKDNSIVFVQRTDELHDGEIGIFVVDGNVMCKRLRKEGNKRWLQPDNDAEEHNPILLTEETACYCQGRVLFP